MVVFICVSGMLVFLLLCRKSVGVWIDGSCLVYMVCSWF